jgi:hypothetical protein
MKNKKTWFMPAAILLFMLALGSCGSMGNGLGSSGPAFAVVVVNNLDTNIEMLWVSPTSRSNWGRDVLGISTVKPGASFRYNVPEAGFWDVRVRDKNGNTYTFPKVYIHEEVRLDVDQNRRDQ